MALPALIVILVYPDVIFLGASFQPSALTNEFGRPDQEVRGWFPDPAYRAPRHGHIDLGAALLQDEPAVQFMHRVLWQRQSPYWNPYQAGGTVGVQSMVDAKTSPVVVLCALLGGGTLAWHAAWLFFCWLGVYGWLSFCMVTLGVHWLAAAAGGVFFLLNGFAAGFLGAQTVHPYLLMPAALHALSRYLASPTGPRLAWAALVHALLWYAGFAPVLLLSLIALHALAASAAAPGGHWLRVIARQGAVAALGLALAAPLWLPTIEFLWSSPMTGDYAKTRGVFDAFPWAGALSLFSPKHFWESYAAHGKGWFGEAGRNLFLNARTIPHLGIAAAAAAAAAWPPQRERRAVWGCCVALAALGLGRIFGVWPSALLDYLPGINIIKNYYWAALIMPAVLVLSVCGIDHLIRGRARWMPPAAVWLIVPAAAGALYWQAGWPNDDFRWVRLGMLSLVWLAAGGLAALALWGRPKRFPWAAALVFLLCLELTYYANHLRPRREPVGDRPSAVVAFLQDHLAGSGQRLLHIGRHDIAPNWGTAFALPQAGDQNGVATAAYRGYWQSMLGLGPGGFLSLGQAFSHAEPSVGHAALDALAVRYIVVGEHRPRFLAFFQASGYPVVFRDGPEKNPEARKVIFENVDALPLARMEGQPGAAVKLERLRHGCMEFSAELPAPGALVAAAAWHPRWRAWVDGEPVPVRRAGGAFLGIEAPSGKHRIVLRHWPALATPGILVALLAAGLLLCFTLHGFHAGYSSSSRIRPKTPS